MKKVPDTLKLLCGKPVKNTPKPAPLKPACPKWLPSAAKRIYKEIAPQLERLGVLTEIDGTALGDYCLCLARLRECEQDIQARGMLVPGDRGQVKNASAQLAREYRAAALKWGKRFGLDPLSRSSLDIDTEPDDDNVMRQFLSGLK